MRIVTWNVNSLRVRLERVVAWLQRHDPDVVCLQETKCPDDQFPRAELEALGYHLAIAGQKGLNGVAILSKQPLEDVADALPGRDDDEQKRYLAATVDGVRVINVYVPNGQALGSEAFFYKLDWLGRLQRVLVSQHDPAQPLVLLGDFNIAPEDRDVYDTTAWSNRLHTSTHERAAVERLQAWGLRDALREVESAGGHFSWFDYRDGSGPEVVEKNQGIRIDLILATPPLVERLQGVRIDLEERRGEQPSDHAPVIADFGSR